MLRTYGRTIVFVLLACFPWIVWPRHCPAVVLAPSLHKIRDIEPWCPQEVRVSTAPLKLSLARNEYESFQVVVNKRGVVVTDIHITFQNEETNISSMVHRAAYINIQSVSDCDGDLGRWPDALVPELDPWFRERRNALPSAVSGENAVFWVDLFASLETAPGVHTAKVSVCLSENGTREVIEAIVQLRVFAFALAASNPKYKSSYGLSPEGILMAAFGRSWREHMSEMVNMTQRYIDLGLMHRLSFTHGGSIASDPAFKEDPIDWYGFNDRWKQYLILGKDMPFGIKSATVASVEIPADPETNLAFQEFAQVHGWADKLVTKVCDEPASVSGWITCNSTCAAVRKVNPKARCEVTSTMAQLHSESNGSMSSNSVSVFTALISFVENSAEHCPGWPSWAFRDTRGDYSLWQSQKPGHEFWMYQSCMSEGCASGINRSSGCSGLPCDSGWPSLMIDAPAIMNRVFPVLGYFYNASGELYWHTNYADTCTRENVIGNCPIDELPKGAWAMDAWKSLLIQGGNGDGQLTYPGHPDIIGGDVFVPIASIRLKQLRDGMEHNEYLHMLENVHGRQVAMRQLRRLVTNAFTYTRDADLWASVWEEIGSMIESGSYFV